MSQAGSRKGGSAGSRAYRPLRPMGDREEGPQCRPAMMLDGFKGSSSSPAGPEPRCTQPGWRSLWSQHTQARADFPTGPQRPPVVPVSAPDAVEF